MLIATATALILIFGGGGDAGGFARNIEIIAKHVEKIEDEARRTRATAIVDEISETYAPDVMLFDMPPLMASDDNFGFLQNVDCALILVAAERTSMSQIDIAERNVAELTNVMGIILNKCRYAKGAYGHEYDYY